MRYAAAFAFLTLAACADEPQRAHYQTAVAERTPAGHLVGAGRGQLGCIEQPDGALVSYLELDGERYALNADEAPVYARPTHEIGARAVGDDAELALRLAHHAALMPCLRHIGRGALGR